MKTSKIVLLLSAGALFLASCGTSLTVSKKQHSSGYYVSFSKNETKTQKHGNTKTESSELATKKAEVKLGSSPVNEVANKEVSAVSSVKNNSRKAETAKSQAKTSSSSSAVKAVKMNIKKAAEKLGKKSSNSISDRAILLYILAVLIPWLAVGLVTNWDLLPVIITLILWLTLALWIIAIIYAIYLVNKNEG